MVSHLGQPMLKITERTSLLVQLPEVLPQDFTVEIDLVPKTCCQPEDVAIEGTRLIDQGPTSANVLWHHDILMVVGGATDNYHGRLPEPLASSVPGKLTHLVLNVQGDNMTLLTNGQQSFALTNRKFSRDKILRVFLGGQNDTDRAVYLARLRVIANSAPVGPLTGGSAPAAVTSVPSRSLALPGFVSAGASAGARSQTLSLAGFTAAGSALHVAPRTLSLAGFTAAGLGGVTSRTITLGGFAAASTAPRITSRTLSLAGWTAAGPP
jgi:hypothetical protein